MKHKRQDLILKIITENKISTHEQLIAELEKRGVNVTQATVSRDMQELGIIKKMLGGEYVYTYEASPETSGITYSAVISAQSAMNTVVLKTRPGSAGAAAALIDARFGSEMLGSVAGDDTIIIISGSTDEAEKLKEKIKEIFMLR